MLSLLAVVQGVAPPTFPDTFYSGMQTYIAINKGAAVFAPNGGMCCSKTNSSQCSFETVNQGQDTWQSAALKMHRFGSVINNYTADRQMAEEYGRQMAVAPATQIAKYANSSHKWACAVYCPMKSEYYDLIEIGTGRKVDPASFLGNFTVTQREAPGQASKMTSEFHWEIHFLGKIIQHANMFVDFTGKSPVPFVLVQDATSMQDLSTTLFQSNISYIQYTPMDTTSFFDVDPDSYAQCELAEQCQDDDTSYTHLPPHLQLSGLRKIKPAAPSRQLPQYAEPRAGKDATPPTVSADYTANVEVYQLAKAGQVTETPAELCCEPTALGQCEVMLMHSHGLQYRDGTNHRVRSEDSISGLTMIDNMHDHTAILVNVIGGVETCQEWCPLNPSEQLGNYTPWANRNTGFPFLDHGQTTIGHQTAEHYSWQEGLVKVGVFTQYEFYADISISPGSAKPLLLRSTDFLEGTLGMDINTTYTDFVSGTPPASKFNIAKGPTEGCPQSKSCGSTTWQAHRQLLGQHATYKMFA